MPAGLKTRAIASGRNFQLGVFRAKHLFSHRIEADEQLGVVIELLDAQHRPDTELRMPDLDARAQPRGYRLVFVFVGVGRLHLTHATRAAVWLRAEL